MVAIRIDGRSEARKKIAEFHTKLAESLQSLFQGLTYRLEIITNSSNLYVLLNYDPAEKENIEAVLQRILNEFKSRLTTFGLLITIGYGEAVTALRMIPRQSKRQNGRSMTGFLKEQAESSDLPGANQGTPTMKTILRVHQEFTKAVELLISQK